MNAKTKTKNYRKIGNKKEIYIDVKSDKDEYVKCCEILKYSQVYEPCRSIVGQERGRTHRDLNECRKIN